MGHFRASKPLDDVLKKEFAEGMTAAYYKHAV